MSLTFTDADFDRLSFHDCHLWGIAFGAGDSDAGDWTSDLTLDIDYIAEWLCGADGVTRFRVAPATLAFHGVTDPRVAIEWSFHGYQVALSPVSIDRIERERLVDQKVYLDRPYYRWRVVANAPAGGEITFGATGFDLTLRREPTLSDRQALTRSRA